MTNDKLNRQINFALRAMDETARAVAESSLGKRSGHIDSLASAIAALTDIQREIYETNPELEYHYDESRPPTKYMTTFRKHLDRADELLAAGEADAAIEELRKALVMEPPPLAHEMLVAKIKEVASKTSI